MRTKSVITTSLGVITAFAVGAVLSVQLAVAADDKDDHEPKPVVLGEFAEDLPPLETLGNGKTAGDWRLEDSPSTWPDFIPVVLPGGVKGYVRFQDMYGEPLAPSTTESTREEVDSREPGAGIEPDDRGEVWADVYDESGKNVIGTWLVASRYE